MRVFWTAYACALLGAALLFPDLLVWHKQSFVWAHDPEAPMHNVFALISQWSHGGIALFDRFDHFNFAYTQLTSGMYTVVNMVLAGVYLICSPFLSSPAEAFHHIYSFGFHALTILLRTVGGYLILKRLGVRPWIVVVALVVLNTMLSLVMYFGLLTNNLYSYLPLLLYFIWVFFEDYSLRDLLAAVLVMTVAAANSPEYAMGYFYMVVHFFIVSCLVLSLRDGSWRRWKDVVRQIPGQRRLVAAVAAVAALIMLPWVWLFKLLNHDFFIAGSGMGETSGRLSNIFNPMHYFAPLDQYTISLAKFPLCAIDFTHNQWEGMWVYMGAGVMVLSLIGLFGSSHKVRLAFAGAILLVIMSNAPLHPASPLSFAHWISVLTNPFHFLLRSFHMPALLLPFLFMPLTALGLQVIDSRFKGRARLAALGFVLLMLMSDGAGAFIYSCHVFTPEKVVEPRVRFGLAGFRPVYLDYQNPLHLPLREYFRATPLPADPIINSAQNLYGLFYKYSPLERYFMEPNIYNPLPAPYKDFYNDTDGQGHNFAEYYLNRDARWMFLADAAVDSGQLPWKAFLALGLERRIALVENIPASVASVLARPQDYQPSRAPLPAARVESLTLDVSRARVRKESGFNVYSWPLPAGVPMSMATGLFTQDKENLNLSVNAQHLDPVQGKIAHPFEFDVNNARQGFISLSLPTDMPAADAAVNLTVKQSGEILDVWRNEHDNIGVTFLAAHDGWLVMHLPYDPKWRITIDGQKVPVYRTNKYFIGTPIGRGEHKVLVQYWPGSPLRILILMSIILTLVALAGVVGFGFRREFIKHG